MKMSNVMKENVSVLNEAVGLYKVTYEKYGLDCLIELLLPLGRKNKTIIKKMIAIMRM